MTENIVHYLNNKMKNILVEIIDLQFFTLLKWDGAYKKGLSWDGPQVINSIINTYYRVGYE